MFEALTLRGWNIRLRDEPQNLPLRVRSKYPVQSEIIRPLVERIITCTNPEDRCWIFTPEQHEEGQAYSFDTYELMSLESTSNAAERAEVSSFWGLHLVFMTNVVADYDYLAVRVDGAVVHGYAPEFELGEVIASSLAEFIRKLELQARCEESDWPYDLLLGDESVA